MIVPSWAKSAGTVIAISSDTIVFGLNSELGPIDPQWPIDGISVPCEILARNLALPLHIRELASQADARMKRMAKDLLTDGMMKGAPPNEIDEVITKISSSTGYLSHGAVIDFEEATALGLRAQYLEPDASLWKRIWLLYCMYDYDTKAKGLGKVFEGSRYSISRPRS